MDLDDEKLATRKLNGADGEIEVGEYVRTKKGIIGIVTDIEEDLIKYKDNNHDYIDYQSQSFDIVKHSHNILDLIEVGDYVNGKEITINYETGKIKNMPKKIKSILTKEQFASVEYKIEKVEDK